MLRAVNPDAEWLADADDSMDALVGAEAPPDLDAPESSDAEAIASQSEPSGWPEPAPLGPPDPPVFPTHVLPAAVRDFVEALATEAQLDASIPAMFALGTLAAAVQRSHHAVVRAGWTEPLGLFVVVVAAPGERKSLVVSRCTEPLNAWEAARRSEHRRLHIPDGDAPPPIPRVMTDDCTPERLASMASEQGGSIAVITAEGAGPFAIAGGRYAKAGPSFDVFLRGHAGDPIRVDRVGRDGVFVARPSITFAAACQPDALGRLLDIPGARGQGLVARFLLVRPRSRVGRRNLRAQSVPHSVAARWKDLALGLLARGTHDPESGRTPLDFDPGATETIVSYGEEIEPRLGPDGDLREIADWSSKAAGAAARVAGILAIADGSKTVLLRHAVAGVHILRCLTAHARAILAKRATPEQVHAAEIIDWALARGAERITKRGLWQALRGRAWVDSAGSLDGPLAVLVDGGWLHEAQAPRAGPGRRAGPTYRLNPRARAARSGETSSVSDALGAAPHVATTSPISPEPGAADDSGDFGDASRNAEGELL